MATPKTKNKHYVDNKKFYTVLLHYKNECEEARQAHKEAPPIPPYVGECLYKIANHLSMKPNFINYTYREMYRDWETDRKSTRLNSSHSAKSRMPSSA